MHTPASLWCVPDMQTSIKRKLSSDEGTKSAGFGPPARNFARREREPGRVSCVCGQAISFRDESTGGFTLKHWDAHRQKCSSASQPPSEPVIYTPESTAEALANPPTKRRRAKRTEEERIDYLQSDPYVAQFEAFRVLCGSCDKWIRLRPNSTYCSIPWDAHRKSCLSKKINNKNVYALDERNALFSKDPDVRKFDAERILCAICDRWLAVSPEDHLQAVQAWLQHRASCQKSAVASSQADAHHRQFLRPQMQLATKVENVHPRHVSQSRPLVTAPFTRPPISGQQCPAGIAPPHSQSLHNSPHSQLSLKMAQDPTPTSFSPSQDARRRNAEQRAYMLRADPLINEVEPGRVFCSLCQKWVQLRQDSSYCAYPWLQHRGKCLARFRKRQARLDRRGFLKADALSDEVSFDSDPESEDDGDGSMNESRDRSRDVSRNMDYSQAGTYRRPESEGPVLRYSPHAPHSTFAELYGRRTPLGFHPAKLATRCGPNAPRNQVSHPQKRDAPRLADLDSPSGRRDFVLASIDHLFSTTYEGSDDMTISTLLTFLNAAMPPDKHEDFDTAELVKAVALLHEQDQITFQGDTISHHS